jgi:hypothetical protein
VCRLRVRRPEDQIEDCSKSNRVSVTCTEHEQRLKEVEGGLLLPTEERIIGIDQLSQHQWQQNHKTEQKQVPIFRHRKGESAILQSLRIKTHKVILVPQVFALENFPHTGK